MGFTSALTGGIDLPNLGSADCQASTSSPPTSASRLPVKYRLRRELLSRIVTRSRWDPLSVQGFVQGRVRTNSRVNADLVYPHPVEKPARARSPDPSPKACPSLNPSAAADDDGERKNSLSCTSGARTFTALHERPSPLPSDKVTKPLHSPSLAEDQLPEPAELQATRELHHQRSTDNKACTKGNA